MLLRTPTPLLRQLQFVTAPIEDMLLCGIGKKEQGREEMLAELCRETDGLRALQICCAFALLELGRKWVAGKVNTEQLEGRGLHAR